MIPPSIILFAKTLSADELGKKLRTAETINGKLVAIGHSATKTAGTYALGQVPTGKLKLVVVDSPDADVPAGVTEVCRGAAWISSTEKWVIVVRVP